MRQRARLASQGDEDCHCHVCARDTPLTATTVTLSCHKVELRPVAARAELRTLFETAYQGLIITPEQLCQELDEGGDTVSQSLTGP